MKTTLTDTELSERWNADGQGKFCPLAPSFKDDICRIALAHGLRPLQVFALWREYSDWCSTIDQSSLVSEFEHNYQGQFEKQSRINDYEAKRADKAERFAQCAENAERRAASAFDRADLSEGKSGIPFGQPILVGHHSERRHRRAIERANNAMRKGIEESDKAKYYARRAANAESNDVIFSDDPAADDKLKAKIADAETLQEAMKACNAAIRKHAKAGAEAQVAALIALGRTEAQARELIKPDFCGRIGFANYQLTNNNANIRRMKDRLTRVTTAQATPATEIEGANARLEDCPAENRVRLFFPGKPSEETRTRLKSGGFRWSPTIGAWQAYRNWGTIETAKREAGIRAEETTSPVAA